MMPFVYDEQNTARRYLQSVGARDPVQALQRWATQSSTRHLAPLPPEAGERMDDVVTRVGTDRLSIVRRLIEDCERPLPDWFSVFSVQYEKISRQGNARLTMTPGETTGRSMADRTPVSTAIYAAEEPFSYSDRFLSVAQSSGVAIEDDSLEAAILNINELIEDVAINGPTVSWGGITMYGLANAPNLNTLVFSGSNPAWDHASKTGEEITDDYDALRALMHADGKYGPYRMFVPADYQKPLGKPWSDGTTTFETTVREMLLKNQELLSIDVADQLPDDTVYLVEMRPSVCGVYVGQDPTWLPMPAMGMVSNFLALACVVPYFRSDYGGGSGIAKGTAS